MDEYNIYLADIEAECRFYDFQDKWVYLPVGGEDSAFWRYFRSHFKDLGLRRLTATTSLNPKNNQTVHCFDLQYQTPDRAIASNFTARTNNLWDFPYSYLAAQCDIVVSSLLPNFATQYLGWLLDSNIKFLLLSPMEVYGDRKIIKYVADGAFGDGMSTPVSGHMNLQVPHPSNPDKVAGVDSDGIPYIKANVRWITNLPLRTTGERFVRPYFYKTKYNPKKCTILRYKTAEGQPIMQISRLAEIPLDYMGIMAVPVSYAKFHDPARFHILYEQTDVLPVNAKKIHKILIRSVNSFTPGMKMGNLELVEKLEQADGIFWTCLCMCKPKHPNAVVVTEEQLDKGEKCHCGCLTRKPPEPPGYRSPQARQKVTGSGLRDWWVVRCHRNMICKEWAANYTMFQLWCMDHGYIDGMRITKKNRRKQYSPQNIGFKDTPASIAVWTANQPKWWVVKIRYMYEPQGTSMYYNVLEWAELLEIPAGEMAHLLLSYSGSIARVCAQDPVLQQRLDACVNLHKTKREQKRAQKEVLTGK